MKSKLLFVVFLFAVAASLSARYVIFTDANHVTTISFTNTFYDGVCTVEGRAGNKWVPLQNFFTTQRVGQAKFKLPPDYVQFRLKAVDVSPGNAFTRLAQSYGSIHTVAGKGLPPPGVTNAWLPEYEGAIATDVYLSDPRYALADAAGNIYVVERGSHAVDKITPDGRIHTFAGLLTRMKGTFGEAPGQIATNSPLNAPSGLWIAGGTLFILDAGNDRIQAVDLGIGIMNNITVDTTPGGMGPDAEGLWVGLTPDGLSVAEAFFGDGTRLKHFKAGVGTAAQGTGFLHVGHVTVDLAGRTIVSDPLDNRVYRVRGTGAKEVVAGTGFFRGTPAAGKAKRVALPGASSVFHLTVGGYLVGLDSGARIWYVDADNGAAPLVFGKPGVNDGDDAWFRLGGSKPKISNVRSVSVAPNGDIIILESEGIIRKIDFLRRRP